MASALQQALGWIASGFGMLGNQAQVQQHPVDQKSSLLDALVKNTLAQTSYTPQAVNYINNQVPIDYYTKPKNMSVANPAVPQNALAVTYGGAHPHIIVDSNILKLGNSQAVEVLRHEINHAMDANVNAAPNAAYPTMNSTSANSRGFYPNAMDKGNNFAGFYLNNFLNSYRVPNPKLGGEATLDPRTADQESFAHYGERGQNVLLDKSGVGSYYKNIFAPMSKRINYSPAFPAPTYDN